MAEGGDSTVLPVPEPVQEINVEKEETGNDHKQNMLKEVINMPRCNIDDLCKHVSVLAEVMLGFMEKQAKTKKELKKVQDKVEENEEDIYKIQAIKTVHKIYLDNECTRCKIDAYKEYYINTWNNDEYELNNSLRDEFKTSSAQAQPQPKLNVALWKAKEYDITEMVKESPDTDFIQQENEVFVKVFRSFFPETDITYLKDRNRTRADTVKTMKETLDQIAQVLLADDKLVAVKENEAQAWSNDKAQDLVFSKQSNPYFLPSALDFYEK